MEETARVGEGLEAGTLPKAFSVLDRAGLATTSPLSPELHLAPSSSKGPLRSGPRSCEQGLLSLVLGLQLPT